jgi:hypothetical protein
LEAASQLGFKSNSIDATLGYSVVPTIWTCPNRPTLPAPNVWPNPTTWAMGYQYYGGFTNNWTVGVGYRPKAPIKTSSSKASWMLAADLVINMSSAGTPPGTSPAGWSDPSKPPNDGLTSLPAHKRGNTLVPAGGNELFADGSAQWIKSRNMYLLYSSISTRNFYYYQDDISSIPALYISGLAHGP